MPIPSRSLQGFHMASSVKIFLLAVAILALSITTPGASPPDPDRNATLSKTTLPATGRQESILTVSRFGRYSVIVDSPQGTALRLVDRMSGPDSLYGVPGEQDGRLDVILDRGEYKIVALSHEKGEGEATLSVHASRERNTPRPPVLMNLKPAVTTLDDLEQRSFWLDIEKRRTVMIEAAGRNLADLRLWKDGAWLLDVDFEEEILEPAPGRPLAARRLLADLNPGLYLLTAYGGPEQKWAETSGERPLYIRTGIPMLAEAGRRRHVASPFGVDRWLAPGKTTFFRLELPEAEEASILVEDYSKKSFPSNWMDPREIGKKSIPPLVEFTKPKREEGLHLITVRREAGKPYILQHFEYAYTYHFTGSAEHWVSTTHSGHAEDSADAAAMLTERCPYEEEKLVGARAVRLNGVAGYRRRFNLLAPMTLFLNVGTPGKYIVNGEGADARYRVEPFLTHRPSNYKAPDFQPGGDAWDLNPGYYALLVEPREKGKGILDLSIHYKNQPGGAPAERTGAMAVRFPAVRLKSACRYTLYLNRQPGVKAGVILRKLPIDLVQPMPFTLTAKETLVVRFEAREWGRLEAIGEDGEPLEISVNKGARGRAVSILPGIHDIAIHNPADGVAPCTLVLRSDRLSPDAPAPVLSEERMGKIPDFPVLRDDHPHFYDARRTERKTFQVRVDAPALYRLESTGLLETEGNLRTRTIPSFDKNAANGVGRNFLIQQYLGRGDYQLSVRPMGRTRGHLGVELARTRLHDGAWLTPDIPGRRALPAGDGLLYRFRIPEKGDYRLRILGLNREFRARLEDEAGWPIITPGALRDMVRKFDPGEYRLVILPQPVDARVVTLLEPVPPKVRREGHGPHALPIGREIRHQWLEPEPGEKRTPDQWLFTAAAPVDAVIRLNKEMVGELHSIENRSGEPPPTPVRLERRVRLETGDYRLEVRSARPDNKLDYSLMISFQQLTPGRSRRVNAPADIPVSVGEESLVEISSLGSEDVRARLVDEEGRLIAMNDDRPGRISEDWNFLIAARLTRGMYRLQTAPVGQSGASTEVSMHLPEEIREEAVQAPAEREIRDAHLHTYPLDPPPGRDIVVISAVSDKTVGMALERKEGERWLTTGIRSGANPVLVAVLSLQPGDVRHRLRIWSPDRRKDAITLRILTPSPSEAPEAQLVGSGVAPALVAGVDPPLAIARVAVDRPGLFRSRGDDDHLIWSPGVNRSLARGARGLIDATGGVLWLATRPGGGAPGKIRADRVSLAEGEPLHVTLPRGERTSIDLAPGKGGPVLILADSRLGAPGASVERVGDSAALDARSMGVGPRTAIRIEREPDNPAGKVARFWNAGMSDAPLPVEVQQHSFAHPETGELSLGVNDLSMEGDRAYEFRLPGGPKQIRLALPPFTAALLLEGNKPVTTCWSEAEEVVHTMENRADRLLLLHASTGEALAGAALTPVEDGMEMDALDSGAVLRRHFSAAGIVHLFASLSEEEARSGMTPRVHGVNARVVAREENGRVKTGSEILLTDDADLAIHHGPGPLVVWLEKEGRNPWLANAKGNGVTVTPPARIPLEGELQILRFTPPEAGMLHMKTTAPVIACIAAGAAPPRVEIFPNGADLDLYLPEGETRVILQAAGPGDLSGSAGFLVSPITRIGEGLGPGVRLGPGESRLFSFFLERDGAVGVGVRSTSDVVEHRLMDAHGARLGSGVVQMHDLKAGTYLLEAAAPAAGPSMEIRPAVVGVEPPGTGPPLEVMRRYLEMAGLKESDL